MTNQSQNLKLRPVQRQARILEALAQSGEASVEALASRFTTSPETIRRDLTTLADAGHIRKLYGRARLASPQGEGDFAARMRRNTPAKHLIAKKLRKLIKPGQTLFMDTGSTTLICADALADIKNLTIITNATAIAARFAAGSGGAEVYLLGGQYRGDNAQTIGPTTLAGISDFSANIALLTIGALNETGAMDFSNAEAMVAKAMIAAAASTTLLADHTKCSTNAPFRLCPLDDISALVSDRAPKPALSAALKSAGVRLI